MGFAKLKTLGGKVRSFVGLTRAFCMKNLWNFTLFYKSNPTTLHSLQLVCWYLENKSLGGQYWALTSIPVLDRHFV